jgi:hypothetical protein
MDLKISQLPQAFFIGVGDLLVTVQGGVTCQFTSPFQLDSDGNVTFNNITSNGIVNVQEIVFPDGSILTSGAAVSAGRIFAISNIFCV